MHQYLLVPNFRVKNYCDTHLFLLFESTFLVKRLLIYRFESMLNIIRIVLFLLGAQINVQALAVQSTATVTNTSPNTWFGIGPYFSSTIVLARDPLRDNIMLAGAYFGGLYRSEDYGFTWKPILSDFSSRSIFSISYSTSSIIYVACFKSGVYKSDNAGLSWKSVNNGITDLDVQAIAADPTNSDIVLAATSTNGVFRSNDGGKTWQHIVITTFNPIGKTIVFDLAHKGTVYLGTIGNGVLKSIDNGLSFQPLNEGLISTSIISLRLGAQPNNDLYAATDNGIYTFQTSKQKWVNLTGNLPSASVNDVLPHPFVEHRLLAATNDGVFVLPDERAEVLNWTSWSKTGTRALIADHTGAVVHAASIHGLLLATNDSGQSWKIANYGLQNLFVGALQVVPSSTGPVVFAGSDFGLHINELNAWGTFFEQGKAIFDIQIDPINPNTLYIGTEQSGLWKSIDAGKKWSAASTNMVPTQIFDLHQSSDGKNYYASTSSGLYISSDNGASWALSNALNFGIVFCVAPDPVIPSFLFVSGTQGAVVRSVNGGLTFENASNGLPKENIINIVTAPWEKTYALTASGALYATSDNGANWFLVNYGIAHQALGIAVDPKHPWIVYMATDGGIYKSESGSIAWTPSNDGLTTNYVFSIAIDPHNPSTLYAGTSEGVFVSTDSAKTWLPINSGLTSGIVNTVQIDPLNSSVLYVAIQDKGLFRSVNGGKNWSSITENQSIVGSVPIVINRLNPTQILAGVAYKGIFRSETSGQKWQSSSIGMYQFIRTLVIDASNPATLYAGSLSAGVFKSVNFGDSWYNIGLTDQNIFKLAVSPKHSETIYAGTSSGLNRTTNGGATWKKLGQQAPYALSMVIDPRDRRIIYIGSTAGSVYRSQDGGDSWASISHGLTLRSIQQLAIDPLNGELYAAPESNGIWKSTDSGNTWVSISDKVFADKNVTSISIGEDHKVYISIPSVGVMFYQDKQWSLANNGLNSLAIADVELTHNGMLLAATYDAGIFRSVNGGKQWTQPASSLTIISVNNLTVDPINPLRVIAATLDGPWISNDDGLTWNPINNGLRGINITSILFDINNSNRLYAGANGEGVYITDDSGLNWRTSNNGLINLDVRTIAYGDSSGYMYIATLGGGVQRSYDWGNTWSGGIAAAVLNSPVLAVAINPEDESTVYVGTGGVGILKSTNYGVDWKSASNGLNDLFILSLVLDQKDPNVLYAGTAGHGVFFSNDAGNSWQPLNNGLMNSTVTSLAVNPEDSSQVFAGTEGGGVFRNIVSLPIFPCKFSVKPGVLALDSKAMEINFEVTASSSDCDWTVQSLSEWLSVDNTLIHNGSGQISILVAKNENQNARSGLINIAGQLINLVQNGHNDDMKVINDANGLEYNIADYIQTKFSDLSVLIKKIGNANTTLIDSNFCGEKFIEVDFNGKSKSQPGGISTHSSLVENFDSLYLTYTVNFSDNFDFKTYYNDERFSKICQEYDKNNCTANSGNLLGLGGGTVTVNTDINTRNRGWLARLGWKEGGGARLNVYHLNQRDKAAVLDVTDIGEDIPLNIQQIIFESGKSYTITLHTVMNAFGQKDGIIEVYINGELVANYNNFEFRNHETNSGNIEYLDFSASLKGADPLNFHLNQAKLSIGNIAMHTSYATSYPFLYKENCLFDLAMTKCSNFFKATKLSKNDQFEDYLYRAYENNYLGIKNNHVFVVGKNFPEIIDLGSEEYIFNLLNTNMPQECKAD